jgi:hypothetical protein
LNLDATLKTENKDAVVDAAKTQLTDDHSIAPAELKSEKVDAAVRDNS